MQALAQRSQGFLWKRVQDNRLLPAALNASFKEAIELTIQNSGVVLKGRLVHAISYYIRKQNNAGIGLRIMGAIKSASHTCPNRLCLTSAKRFGVRQLAAAFDCAAPIS